MMKGLWVFGLFLASAALAEGTNGGDTAWMLTATALVLLMTPALAFFYGGLVGQKNVLNTMMMSFSALGAVALVWALFGYSIAYDGLNKFFGGASMFFMRGIDLSGGMPALLDVAFQGTFAVITVALISGSLVGRIRFFAWVLFSLIWTILVYAVLAHWVWGPEGHAFLKDLGALDFAGGTVVHINAGVAGLMAAIIVGKRKGFPRTSMMPHNLMFTLVGAAMLWVGWFGFNAGSELAADGTAGMAMAVTQIATAMAAVTWMLAEWITHGKPSALGIASGAVAGLVAITPASGSAGPMGALAIGAAAGLACFIFVAKIKPALGLDDSLDAFGVHGIGGITGAILTGVFCAPSLGGAGFGVENGGIGAQVTVQLIGVVSTFIYTAVVTAVILFVLKVTIGLRVTEEQEVEGLDLSQHDERAYNL